MAHRTVLIANNAAWNVVNFRGGLIRALQRAGHRVIALAPEDQYASRLGAMAVDFHPIEMDKKGVSPFHDLRLLMRYRRAFRRLKPDVLLGYTAKPNIYGSLAAQSLGIKVINNVSGLGTAFIRESLLTRLVSGLYRVAFRRSHTVFFQNEDDLNLFLGAGVVQRNQAVLLPGSGVDLARFAPSPQLPSENFRLLLVARLLWDKGIGEYVTAARLVRAKVPHARFQILGFLDAENRTAISRDEVDAWAAEGVIEYLGETDDVRPFIGAADCVVLPSYREGLPRSLLEAAAMGKPMIATDVPGCRDVVDDGVNGFLCPPRDAAALAEAVLRMIQLSPAERSSLGAASRRKAEDEFDETKVFAHYLSAINTALSV